MKSSSVKGTEVNWKGARRIRGEKKTGRPRLPSNHSQMAKRKSEEADPIEELFFLPHSSMKIRKGTGTGTGTPVP